MEAIRTPLLFDGDRLARDRMVIVEGRRVVHVGPAGDAPPGAVLTDLPAGAILAPGFIDVQVNGGGGVLLNDDPGPAGAAAIVAAHRRHGTTGCLPTLITDRPEVLSACLAAAGAIAAVPGVLGLHAEGPFINPVRKGVHRADFIRVPDPSDIEALRTLARAGRSMITLAPERMPDGFVRDLAAAGLRVSIGHSEASAEEVEAAVRDGATAVTHLFNAQSQMQGRAPGVVGAAMATDRLFVSLIADGLHVHPMNLRAAFRAIGPERLMLITDAMSSVGAATDRFDLMGREVRLEQGRLTTADGTLAGAHLGMDEAVRNAVAMMDASLPQALAMASRTPAHFLGLADTHGRIAAGAAADLVALDADLKPLGTWIGGDHASARDGVGRPFS
ncbi:N-acetylglucosamine-6-phosphate deacetylase [Prosthecomicrobium sp. N25]|uniref:N-acetylglucosamine-6-phosphate deacetylase n=1 Tax=Prosthecomicrobium sp. N25 TaxID=3129254 RepID=UPI003076F7C5